MKKLLIAAVAALGLFSLASCGGKENTTTNPTAPQVDPTIKDPDNNNTPDKTPDKTPEPTPEKTPEPTPDVNPDETIDLTVKVKLPDGSELKDFKIQYCNDVTCFPKKIAAVDGVVKKSFTEDTNYYPHIASDEINEKYAYNINGYVQNKNNKDVVIQLYDIKAPTAGDGTEANPFVIVEGGIRVDLAKAKDQKAYKFVAPKAGKYLVESVAQFYAATKTFDPAVKVNGKLDKDSGVDKNFKLEFEATEGQEIEILILGTVSDNIYPAAFDVILKEVK